MPTIHQYVFGTAALVSAGLIPFLAGAEAPDLKTPSPVIYLADNLDEQDKLGWCIDTVGRGFSEKLHAHSCKPQGGDVQFFHDTASGQIVSAEFAGKCATLNDQAGVGVTFDLLDCAAGMAAQRFSYNTETGSFQPAGDESLCIAVGDASRTAGPFMSRDLELVPCAGTNPILLQWVINSVRQE